MQCYRGRGRDLGVDGSDGGCGSANEGRSRVDDDRVGRDGDVLSADVDATERDGPIASRLHDVDPVDVAGIE